MITLNKYGNNSRLIFSDTNSLTYEIKTENVYQNFSKDEEMFDLSKDSTKPKYYHDSNKLLVGKIKGETAGVAIKEFVGLKPKMSSISVDDSSKHKKAKGANKVIMNMKTFVEKYMFKTFDKYKSIKPIEIYQINLLNQLLFSTAFCHAKKYYFNFLSSQNSFFVKL